MQPRGIFFLLLVIIPCWCFAQNSGTGDVGSIAASLITEMRQQDKERIFLQTDKKVYEPGETIWFKAFIVDSLNNRIAYDNRILYVDLVDKNDSAINVLLLHGDKANINGSIILTDSSMQGSYLLRAYTKKMIESNNDNIGLQAIYVVNNKSNGNVTFSNVMSNTSPSSEMKPVVEIYPEGGWLISGTNSVVALKVHDQNGKPMVTSCIIKDNRDTVVARVNTNQHGLAKFSFSPIWFGKYKVYLLNKDRYDSAGMLPRVNPYAAQLSVEEQNDESIKVRVMLEDSLYTQDYTTYIFGMSKDSLCFAAVGRGMYELNIPASNFLGGVANLLLFNEKRELVSERDIYVNKKNVIVNIVPDQQNYWARDNAKLNIKVTDASGKPLAAALSVSVVDARLADTSVGFDDELAQLTAPNADLVMLTQEPAVQQLLNLQSPAINNETGDETLTVKGKVVNKKNESMSNFEVMLMSNKENLFVLQDTTDDKGEFSFRMPDYDDGTQFNVQVNDMAGHKTDDKIMLDPFKPLHFKTPSSLRERSLAELKKSYEENNYDSVVTNMEKGWLTPVKVATGVNSKKNNRGADNIISREMLRAGGVNNIGTAILQTGKFHLINGFLMEGGSNGFAPSALDEPTVIMDGLQVTLSDPDPSEISPVLSFLKSVPADQVDYIRVLAGTEAGIYGVRSGHGVIEIHTTTKLKDYSSPDGRNIIYPKGFHVPATFLIPDYSNKEIKKSKTPDFRTTIYWNGDLITDKDGKASVNFFTADMPATYVVTVTGITSKGEVIDEKTAISRK